MSKVGFAEVACTLTCCVCGGASCDAGAGSAEGAVVCARAAVAGTVTHAMSRAPCAAARIAILAAMCLLPCADAPTAFVEDPRVVALAQPEARLGRQLTEHRRPHVEHRVVRRGTRWRHRVGPEEKAIGVLVEERG